MPATANAKTTPKPQLLLDRHDRVFGFVRLGLRGDGVGELASLGLRHQARGMGLGAQLVAHGLALLAKAGVPKAHLEVAAANARATALYERFGFVATVATRVFRKPAR